MNELSRGNGDGGGFGWPRQVLQPIGPLYEPITREVGLGILPPQDASDDFELNDGMLCLVERSTFKGNPFECPLEHLDRFERLCRLFRMNGVPKDTVRMTLFPFSLEGKGAYWERNIPSNQVSTWGNVKTEFLRTFFPKQETAKFRYAIQSFEQGEDESFSDAWDRLKEYTMSCPHHGVSKVDLLSIFYHGVLDEDRRTLDTASYGSFASLDVKQAEYLIDTLAQDDVYSEDDYPPMDSSFPPQGVAPIQQLQMEDPLEIASVVEEDEHEFSDENTNSLEEILDGDEEMVVEELSKQEVTELPKHEESDKEDHKGSAHDEAWSELKAPELELKPLPKGLRYAFLGPNSTYPVIINDVFDDEVKWLLVELSEYRNAIGFSLDDIQGISHSLCIHHTHLEEESKISIEHQKGLNPNQAFYCSLLGVSLPILCRLLWWLSLLLLALLVNTKLKLFPG